jgi:Leucine-rich repeat (LRR) protein
MTSSAASIAQSQEKLVSKSVRVTVIGEQGCGKSTFVEQFLTGQGRLSKSAVTFETERTVISRIIKREAATSALPAPAAAAPNRPEIVRYDVHVHDSCASPETNFLALESASTADFVIVCFNMYGGNISVLFQILLDLFKVCYAASRPRPPFMLVGLNKNWEKTLATIKESSQKDSKPNPAKPSENLHTIVSRILDMFQCKLHFVVLYQDLELDGSGKPGTLNQNSGNSGNHSVHFLPNGFVTASDVFARAMDEYEISMSKEHHIRASVTDLSVYRIYYSAQHERLACILKNSWTKDTNVDVFIFPDFVGISVASCNLTETPPKIFDVTELQALELMDNPLIKLSDGFSSLSMLSVLNVSNSKLSVEPAVLVACTSLTHLNLSRNSLSNATCLLKCVSLILLDISENSCPLTIDSVNVDVKLSALTHLNLSKTFCTSIDFIGFLVNIADLNLRDTGIRDGSLPFLSQLVHLRHVDISHNKISAISIPVHLETLLLDNNELKSFEISCLESRPHNLTKLSLRNNLLSELPKQLWHVLSLKDLSFAGNSVSMLDFSFAFCGSRIVNFDGEGNPFNLMPPAVTDLLGNNRFSEACDISIKAMPFTKIAVISKTNSPTFDSITRQLSRISMIVNVQEKSSTSSKSQWSKMLIVAILNPPRLYILNPETDADGSMLEARIKDKQFLDISHPTFKFTNEVGGLRQFLGTVSVGSKGVTGTVLGKTELFPISKTIDFFSNSNRQLWEQYFKAIPKIQVKNDHQNIFFKSMPGYLCKSAISSAFKGFQSQDVSSPIVSSLTNPVSPRLDPALPMLEPDFSKITLAPTDASSTNSTQSSAAPSSGSSSGNTLLATAFSSSDSVGKVSSLLEQQASCKYNSVFICASIVDMKYFSPFLANTEIIVVNMAEDSYSQSELSVILSGIKLMSRQHLKYIFCVQEPGQSASFIDALGEKNGCVVKLLHHQAGSDIVVDQIQETLVSMSSQREVEPFADYFQSFIAGVIKNRPPWTDDKSMMITFSEMLECIVTRLNSFDPLGKCCLSFLKDAAHQLQRYLLQTLQFLDQCGTLVCCDSHTSDPVIIYNMDMFVQDVIIPLLSSARHRKQVFVESRQQSRIIFTPQERAQIWSNVPSMTPKCMNDLDWALLSLHFAAVSFETPLPLAADSAPSIQPSRDSLPDRSQPNTAGATQKKEGWIYHEDGASRSVKKQWFSCGTGPDGVGCLVWRNSESASVTSGNQSISFAKNTKTTVSQTKRNRAGWTHCCRIDHEDSRTSAKKVQLTKVVMCFNSEKEMRDWWSCIEAFAAAPRAQLVGGASVPDQTPSGVVNDIASFNVVIDLEDEYLSKESMIVSSVFEDVGFIGFCRGMSAGASAPVVSSGEHAPFRWLGFVASIESCSEYILRSFVCSMSMYITNSSRVSDKDSVQLILKRHAVVASSDDVDARRTCAIAVLTLNERSSLTEISVVSAGHECNILAQIVLESLAHITRNGRSQFTVRAIENIAVVSKTHNLPAESFWQFVPSILLSNSYISLISRPSVPRLRRIIHIHSKPVTESSKLIEALAMSNNWQYLKYSCLKSDCNLAADMMAACERLVLILEVPIVHFRGRLVSVWLWRVI